MPYSMEMSPPRPELELWYMYFAVLEDIVKFLFSCDPGTRCVLREKKLTLNCKVR